MKIYPKNRKTALDHDHESLIKGFGLGRDGKIYMEYQFSSNTDKRTIIAVTKTRPQTVFHTCPAVQNEKPCWHLGAISLALTNSLPIEVEIQEQEVTPSVIIKDMTQDILDKQGDFEILEVIEEDVPEEDAEIIDLPENATWLEQYGFPSAVLKKILAFRDKQENSLTDEQKARIPNPEYIQSGTELINAVSPMLYGKQGEAWEAPLLIGPKGSGKSTMAETLAAILMLPVNKIMGGIDINKDSLLGSKTLVPAEELDIITEAKLREGCKRAGIEPDVMIQRLRSSQMRVGFDPGILVQAVEKGELLVIDEVNMLIPEVTSLLHGLLDWQKTLPVSEYKTIEAPASFRLVGCMNFGYSGTKALNEAFKDRFRPVKVPHLKETLLAELISEKTKCNESVAEKLAILFKALAEGVENGDLPEAVLSVRSLFRIAREEVDGCGTLKSIATSVLTEGLEDDFEAKQTSDVIEAHLG